MQGSSDRRSFELNRYRSQTSAWSTIARKESLHLQPLLPPQISVGSSRRESRHLVLSSPPSSLILSKSSSSESRISMGPSCISPAQMNSVGLTQALGPSHGLRRARPHCPLGYLLVSCVQRTLGWQCDYSHSCRRSIHTWMLQETLTGQTISSSNITFFRKEMFHKDPATTKVPDQSQVLAKSSFFLRSSTNIVWACGLSIRFLHSQFPR